MSRRNLLLASTISSGGGMLIENKGVLVDDGVTGKIHFEYPVNSYINIIFSDGNCFVVRGKQTASTGYPSFDKPTIIKIEPPSDDIYQYTF